MWCNRLLDCIKLISSHGCFPFVYLSSRIMCLLEYGIVFFQLLKVAYMCVSHKEDCKYKILSHLCNVRNIYHIFQFGWHALGFRKILLLLKLSWEIRIWTVNKIPYDVFIKNIFKFIQTWTTSLGLSTSSTNKIIALAMYNIV